MGCGGRGRREGGRDRERNRDTTTGSPRFDGRGTWPKLEVGATRTRIRGETNIREAGCARARGQEYVEARLILISVHATTPAVPPQPPASHPTKPEQEAAAAAGCRCGEGEARGRDGKMEGNKQNGDGE